VYRVSIVSTIALLMMNAGEEIEGAWVISTVRARRKYVPVGSGTASMLCTALTADDYPPASELR